jgi:hypothetical protein
MDARSSGFELRPTEIQFDDGGQLRQERVGGGVRFFHAAEIDVAPVERGGEGLD